MREAGLSLPDPPDLSLLAVLVRLGAAPEVQALLRGHLALLLVPPLLRVPVQHLRGRAVGPPYTNPLLSST